MTWLNASSAGPTRQLNGDALVFIPAWPLISEAASDTAPITRPKPPPSLPQPLEQSLHRRAIRICNREPRAIAKYMQTHQNLHRAR